MTASQWAAAVAFALVMTGGTAAVAELLARLADQLARDTAAIEAQNAALRQRNAAAQTARVEAARPDETTQDRPNQERS